MPIIGRVTANLYCQDQAQLSKRCSLGFRYDLFTFSSPHFLVVSIRTVFCTVLWPRSCPAIASPWQFCDGFARTSGVAIRDAPAADLAHRSVRILPTSCPERPLQAHLPASFIDVLATEHKATYSFVLTTQEALP